jgi:lipoate-protein ligase A
MNSCDLTLPTPAENLACDEAFLDACEAGTGPEVLRFWQPAGYFVALGYANAAALEVNLPFCDQNAIPVLRRCTGGGTVLQGPGCLNYSLILRLDSSRPLDTVRATNQFILRRHLAALTPRIGSTAEIKGQTDLAVGGRKFSGNAQRRHKSSLLFHGAFLLNLDFSLIEATLRMPSKQPDYRQNRSHIDFLMNLGIAADELKSALLEAWGAVEALAEVPTEHSARLVREKYGRQEWNRKF